MRRASSAIVLTAASVLTGCQGMPAAGIASMGESDMMMRDIAAPGAASLAEGSLFPADQAVLSNEAIGQIFETKVRLRSEARMAVLRIDRVNYPGWGWSEDLSELDRQILDRFRARVSAAGRLRDVVPLPALLVPAQRTVPHLRAAAARYQADFLLLYRAYDRTFEKSRLFDRDTIRTQAVVEAVLLDTRTGLVPYATLATEGFTSQRQKSDMDDREARMRISLEAMGNAMEKVASDLAGFLEKMPADGKS